MEVTEDIAYAEVYEIIRNMENDVFNKLPSNLIKLIDSKRNVKYNCKLETSKKLNEQNISYEAKTILAAIYCKYLATDTQKAKIQDRLNKYKIEKENKKREIYDIDVFKKYKEKQSVQIQSMQLIPAEQTDTFFVKIKNFIKGFFRR